MRNDGFINMFSLNVDVRIKKEPAFFNRQIFRNLNNYLSLGVLVSIVFFFIKAVNTA